MSAPATAAGPVDAEAEYFQAVEEYFVSRRGDPLLLSNADWLLIGRWRRAGIPLRIVLRGIRDALDGHAHSWGHARKVRSLRYCEQEVATASERWHRAVRFGQDGELAQAQHLASLADTLRQQQGLPAQVAAMCATLASELAADAAAECEPARLELSLQERERRLLKVVRDALDAQTLRELEMAIEQDFAPYRERMPAPVLEQVRSEALARHLLERMGLPRLTLFHAG
jgi:hypothetical protein